MPASWWVGIVCEEFHCRPSEAEEEIDNAPDGWLEEIIEARRFAETKRQMDAATDPKMRPTGPLADLLMEIDLAVAAEELDG